MKIEINNETPFRLEKKFLKKIILATSSFLKISSRVEVSVVIVSPFQIQVLNKKYRKKNKVTTILSFSYIGGKSPKNLKKLSGFLGELIVCLEEIKRQAKMKSRSPSEELAFNLVHGFLHLLGTHHETLREEKKGRVLERKILNKIFLKKSIYAP